MSKWLSVDRVACAGHGLCYGTAPDLIDSDEQGDPVILFDPVPDERIGDAANAVSMCPERALSLVDAAPGGDG